MDETQTPRVRPRKTRFARWLARHGHSIAEIARVAGVSEQVVRDARDSHSRSVRIAARLSEVTGGAVSVADLCGGR